MIIKNMNNIISQVNNDMNKVINDKQKEIIDLLNKDINNVNINDENGSGRIFKNIDIILKNIKEETELKDINMYVYKTNHLILNTKLFSKLVYFHKYIYIIVYNFIKLFRYNSSKKIKILYMFILLIDYMFNQYYISNNYIINKFTTLIYNDETYLDDSMITYGVYGELVNSDDIDNEEQYENDMNNIEENDAIDIDVESDDDYFFEQND
jgi:hypothetical protein